MMVGLCQPDAGSILLDGETITDLPMYKRARQGIGYLPQESSVFRRLSVEENIMAILEMMDLSAPERTGRVDALLKELDLTHLKASKAYALSGGERQRQNPRARSFEVLLLNLPASIRSQSEHQKSRLKQKQIGSDYGYNVRNALITDRTFGINEVF
jgi:lipopolysaccharide export system ATP-binding protein